MDTRRTFVGVAACASALAFGALATQAGDIDPPAGPVNGTMKTLDDVEPRTPIGVDTTPGDADSVYRIDQPGSYYLTEPVMATGAASERGIEIAASGVSIDLMGFEVVGAIGSGDGITFDGPIERVRIVNGMVRDWSGSGVHLWNVSDCVMDGLIASGNGNAGIWAGPNSIVARCVARGNLGNDDGSGIEVGFGSTVSSCTAESNTGSGISGSNCRVGGCVARLNGGSGISTGTSVIFECTAEQNTGNGIGTTGGVISSCVARQNGGDGLWASDSSVISNCTSLINSGNGIHVRNSCTIMNNNCRSNGSQTANGAGIYAEEFGSRIEGNNLYGNDRGIDVDGTRNIIVGNSASTNTTNYDIAAGNSVGQILNVNGATITSSNPWQNFEY